MHPLRHRPWAHFRFRGAAYIVLLIALVPTLLVYWRVEKNVRTRDAARFSTITTGTSEALHEHLERWISDLRAVSGFVEARGGVTDKEWESFLEVLDFAQQHPGVRSIGVAGKVTAGNRDQFLQTVRERFHPHFEISPVSHMPLMFPTVLIRQFPTNSDNLLGWDSYSDLPRRAALDAVLRTGLPAATGKLTYWTRNVRDADGFTVFVPIHATNGHVRGALFSSFAPQRLFDKFANKQFSSTVSIELFAGTEPRGDLLLASLGVPPSRRAPSFTDATPVRVLDQTFLLRINTLPAFDGFSDAHAPLLVLAGGLALSFLMFGITWRQANARSAAETLNLKLRESEERLRSANEKLEKKIAEAKVTQGLLAYERDLLRMLLDHSPDSIYFKDCESRFLRCGKAVVQRLGLKNEAQAVGKTDRDFFAPEHAEQAFKLEQEIIRTGHPVTGLVEKETRRHDGHECWLLTSKMPLRDNHGNIIGTFGISKDISELKAVDLALEKEKELLAVTLRSIGDGVITTDVDGRIVLFNQVAEQVTGWTQADAAGRQLEEVFRTATNPYAADAAPDSSPDAVLLTRAGSEKTISRSIAPIIDHQDHKVGAVLVFRDITDKLKTEAELLKANKLESIGVLAGGIAHDFNNILTVILGNISLARMGDSAGRPITDALAEAEKASLRARELTHRLLTFAKGGSPIRRPIDLAALVRACATRALQGSGTAVEFFMADSLWPVCADESQVGQVVQNLIAHACASMSKDPRLDIHVLNQEISHDALLLLKPGNYVRVSIRDFGAGLQPEHLTKIFEPYFGVKKQGSGLELATAYSIVRKHDGQIRVESISGQGTVFHVYLPAMLDAPRPAAPAQRSLFSHNGPRRILVMDDELPIRKLATLLLQRIGHTATTVADGAEAIQVYEAARQRGEPFHAVIMDLTIPQGMGGKETIRQLKELDPKVRAIVSSGYSNDPVMAEFREYGFSGVVPKPYNSEDLAGALDELFDETAHLQTDPADVGTPA
jgi:PAS domain S-box-containing protein